MSEIISFVFSIIGIISILFFFTFMLIVWKMENISIVINLVGCDKTIYERIYNLLSFCDFCGIKGKIKIVLIAYGVPEWFSDEIREYYKNYDFLKIVKCSDRADEI